MSSQPPDWSKIARSSSFQALLASKRRFLIPVTLFFLAFYFSLPLLTSYTNVLNGQAVGSITWAWVLAFGQFVMTWALCSLYTRQAAAFDVQAAAVVAERE